MGQNTDGQLGTTDTTARSTPTLVMTNVLAMGAGDFHSLAVKQDGSAWAWGKNLTGQLGNGTQGLAPNPTPAPMTGVADAVAIYGGTYHSVIRLANGTLLAVGSNSGGQIGDDTFTQRLTAVPVLDLTNIQHVAVGGSHNLAVDSSGTLWVWGDGGSGRLGNGNQSDVKRAVAHPSLANLAWIDAGFAHSIAVDSTGVVSTWGTNFHGELGDGTVNSGRWTPEAISAANYEWRTATPTFSVASGTYTTTKNVVVNVATLDTTIRYTLNGAEPTESDAQVASGSTVSIDQSRTLKAKAWKTGQPASAVQSAAYTLQALTPTITIPSGGPFSTTQTVSMSTGTADSTIRYTLDGTNPTASSPAYNPATQVPVDQTTTIKSSTFKTGWSASGVQTGTITFNYGALDPPAIDPTTGNYAGTVIVTMSSTQNDAIIRYTTNASTPMASSTAYSGAIPISQTTTIKAKAFHSSYSASAETSRTFTMSAATPTLSVAAGSYAPGSTVTISTTEPTATLRMTIDGNDPTSTSPLVAAGTSLILGNFTLKVKAFRSGVGDARPRARRIR
jgi:hypothetical protein